MAERLGYGFRLKTMGYGARLWVVRLGHGFKLWVVSLDWVWGHVMQRLFSFLSNVDSRADAAAPAEKLRLNSIATNAIRRLAVV